MFESIRSTWHERVPCDGVSYLANEAAAMLERKGWTVTFHDGFDLATRGKMLRELPHSDSLGSLVYRDHVKALLAIHNNK